MYIHLPSPLHRSEKKRIMADSSMAIIAQTRAVLAVLPLCAEPAFDVVNATACGPNFGCVCTEYEFGFIALLLSSPLTSLCLPQDIGQTLAIIPQLCVKEVPSLKESRWAEAAASIAVVWTMSIIAVILRLIARKISSAKYGVDDILIVVGLIFSSGLAAGSLYGNNSGFGEHMIKLSLAQVTRFSKGSFAVQIFFAIANSSIKLSVLSFYHRIFPFKRMTIIGSIIGLFIIAWCITYFALIVFNCRPIQYFWDKSIPGGKCIGDGYLESYLLGAGNIMTDIAVLVLPIPWLLRLKLGRGKKMALIATFVIGSFVCIAGILRMPFVGQIKGQDITYTLVNLGIWINVECCIGIVCACIPTLRPLVRARFPDAFRTRFTRSRSSKGRSGMNKGSLRLTDEESSGNGSSNKTKTITSTAEGPDHSKSPIVKESSKEGKHKTWFGGTQTSKDDHRTRKGSMEEEMVPMGNIAFRNDVEWINVDSDATLGDKTRKSENSTG